jgi:acetoin utilization protein AcuC
LPGDAYVEAPMASPAELTRFHDAAYVTALQMAEAAQSMPEPDRTRFRLGMDGNPVYREMFRRPAISAGGVMLAARLTAEGGVVYCPGGGTHHGRRDRAAGFCFLNDPVLGLLTWLDLGLSSIVYLDIDAHHGDGVQDAFHEDERVLTISVHEAGRWPFTGAVNDRAGGAARNFPVPPGCNDTEFRFVMEHGVLPLIEARQPQAIMLQAGADALEEDPLSRLCLSNNAHAAVAAAVVRLAPRVVVLGGGGYNPWSVGRCWAGIWAALNDLPVPERLSEQAEAVLRGLRFDRAAGRNPQRTGSRRCAARHMRAWCAKRYRTWWRRRVRCASRRVVIHSLFPLAESPMISRRLLLALAAIPAVALAQPAEPTSAQPALPKEPVDVVTRDGVRHEFQVEMALTPEQQRVGEMFRKSVPPDGGMLFDWGRPRESQMWMKNTLVPLDMVFINADGTIRSIAENTVPESLAVIDSRGPVRATLELAGGTTERLNIRVGDRVEQRIFGNAPAGAASGKD